MVQKTCLRVHEIGRTIWILIGTILRLGESIGLHRDGALLKLSPYETEIRLRLWWHLCLLDSRSPEDHGFEYTLDLLNRGPRPPLNVDDCQLYPDMRTLPVESDSWTEMSFMLAQIEAARVLHPVLATTKQDSDSTSSVDPYHDIQAKRNLVAESMQRAQRRYISKCDMSIPLHRAAFHHYHSICDKLNFMLQLREEIYLPQHPQQTMQGREQEQTQRVGGMDSDSAVAATATDDLTPNPNPSSDNYGSSPRLHTSPSPSRRSFQLAYETLKRSCFLLTDECSSYLKWIFRAHTQWYALAYMLRCLFIHPQFPGAAAAWDLVERTFRTINQLTETTPLLGSQSSSVWSCLKTLREQALRKREEQDHDVEEEEDEMSVSSMFLEWTNQLLV